MNRKYIKKILFGLTGFFLMCSLAYAREIIDLLPDHPGVLFCWTETRSEPRPLKTHFLMIDLTSKSLEVRTIAGDDPDGNGPAESQLTSPIALFKKYNAVAAVNANAFDSLSKEKTAHLKWFEGQAVDIHGMVVSEGKTVSPVETRRTVFWIDSDQRPNLGTPEKGASVAEAVSDWFSPLIVDSMIMPDTSYSEKHPRTALGFDNSGKWLLLAVVDGRQPGYSEGVTLYELAKIMQAMGCTQSINLDGGGSSIMLIREPDNTVRTLNRPSDGAPRPVPVLLAVMKR